MSDKEGNADASDDLPLDDDLDDEGTDGIVLDEGDDALEDLEDEDDDLDDIDFGDDEEDGKGKE